MVRSTGVDRGTRIRSDKIMISTRKPKQTTQTRKMAVRGYFTSYHAMIAHMKTKWTRMSFSRRTIIHPLCPLSVSITYEPQSSCSTVTVVWYNRVRVARASICILYARLHT